MIPRLKSFAGRNAVAFLALFVALGGTATAASQLIDGKTIKKSTITSEQVKHRSLQGDDIARSTVTQLNIKNETVLSQDIRDGHVRSSDIQNGGVHAEDLSADLRAQVAGGAAGKDGAKGADGAQGPAGSGGGAQGEKGEKGEKGDTGAIGAPGGFVVKDVTDTTAGTLLSIGSPGTQLLTFYFEGRSFSANAATGALALPKVTFYYDGAGCTGGRFVFSRANLQQTALSSSEATDSSIYEYGPTSTADIKSYWSPGMFGPGSCQSLAFSQAMISMTALSAGDTPPTLTGPLSFVPAS
jgi:hypothetical protein